jgi:ankyrin repeat protein
MSKPAGWDPSAGDFKRSEEERMRREVELQPGKAETPKGPLTEVGRSALDIVGLRVAQQRYEGGDLKALGERISKLSFGDAVREAEQLERGKFPAMTRTIPGMQESSPLFADIARLYREHIYGLFPRAVQVMAEWEPALGSKEITPSMKGAQSLLGLLNTSTIQTPEKTFLSPLHAAVYLGDLARIRALIDLGVDLNYADEIGRSPLSVACRFALRDVVQLLLAQPQIDLHARDVKGQTALHVAAADTIGDGSVLRLLLQAEADTVTAGMPAGTPEKDRARAEAGRAAIQLACKNPDNWGQTPLDVAIQYDNGPIVREMVQAGADVNVLRLKDDATPLIIATSHGATEVVRELLAAPDIALYAKDKYGYTALRTATDYLREEIATLLRHAGATE